MGVGKLNYFTTHSWFPPSRSAGQCMRASYQLGVSLGTACPAGTRVTLGLSHSIKPLTAPQRLSWESCATQTAGREKHGRFPPSRYRPRAGLHCIPLLVSLCQGLQTHVFFTLSRVSGSLLLLPKSPSPATWGGRLPTFGAATHCTNRHIS